MDGEATINRVGYTTIKRDEGVTDAAFSGRVQSSRMMKEKRLVGEGARADEYRCRVEC